ncbi:MFS transporter [Pyrodictium occultum]|uniref:MFS transporter n=1 Tax=Pyrodictium occultum TaxID=2309 RepID=UPI000AA791DC|nr:MFS transporter [Pyrodictium occultum]
MAGPGVLEEGYDLAYAKKAAALLVTLPLLVMYTEAALIPALPAVQEQYHVSPSSVSWVLSIYLLSAASSVAVMGRLGDIHGKKRVFLAALAIYTAGVALTGFAPSFPALLAARALQGVGMAIFPLGFTMVREEFPPRMVPQVQGLISSMFGVGVAIALPLGGYVDQRLGWQWTYRTAAVPAAAFLALSARMLRESRYRSPGRLDVVGAVLLAVAAAASLTAVTMAPYSGWASPHTLGLFAASAAVLAALILHERRAEHPLVPLELFREANVVAVYMGVFLVGFTAQMRSQALSYLLQMPPPYGYGRTTFEAGSLMAPVALASIVTSPLAGRAIVAAGAKPVAGLGALISMVSLAALAYNPTGAGLWWIVGFTTLTGVGMSLLNVSLINILVFTVDRGAMGVATGLNTLFRSLGSAWGPAVAGSVMSLYSARILLHGSEVEVPLPQAYTVLFLAAAALYAALAAASLRVREVVRVRVQG